jgi:hypothetical protein
VVTPFARLSKKAADEVTQEGLDLVQRVAPATGHEIEFTAAS